VSVSAALASSAEGIMQRAAAVRSLPATERVPLSLLPRTQLRSYLIARMEQEQSRAELEKDQAAYILLDLLREGDDLYQHWLGLLSEQVVGLYEPDSRRMRLVTAADRLAPMDEIVLAHEYVHALQDQNFGAFDRLKAAKGQGEKSLGLVALTEGDASVGSALYAQKHLTRDQLSAAAGQSGGLSSEKLRGAPLVLVASLLFPYSEGAAFVNALYQRGGWPAVDRAYAEPPTTSEQISHVEKYLSGEGAAPVDLPDLKAALGPEWLLWKEDALGELGLTIYLANGLPTDKATAAAEGWGGDRMLLFRSRSGYQYALAAATTWDTPEDALQFYSAAQELQTSRRGISVASREERKTTWTSATRTGYVGLEGSRVSFVIAPDEITRNRLVDALKGAAGRS
jgi:hypothetical protein